MNSKTRDHAKLRLNEYKSNGVTWQYTKSGRWNWATEGSGCYEDILNTLSEDGSAMLNPDAMPAYRIPVHNVKFHGAVA